MRPARCSSGRLASGSGVAGWNPTATRWRQTALSDSTAGEAIRWSNPSGPWVEVGRQPTSGGTLVRKECYAWMGPIGLLDVAAQMQPQYSYGAAGLRCINGDQSLCVNSVLHSAIAPPATAAVPKELTVTGWRSRPEPTNVGTVRPPTQGMISDLIIEHGRDRFQKFWSSHQPFEVAFQDAFGESLGAWTARWSRQQWLGTFQAKQFGPGILLGVTLKTSWLPPIVGWSVLALAIAAMVAKRRTA